MLNASNAISAKGLAIPQDNIDAISATNPRVEIVLFMWLKVSGFLPAISE